MFLQVVLKNHNLIATQTDLISVSVVMTQLVLMTGTTTNTKHLVELFGVWNSRSWSTHRVQSRP